jgi:spermine/spermidine synthase
MKRSLNHKMKVFDARRILGDLHSEVDIPDAVVGNFSISHKDIEAGKIIEVVTMRNMLFMGYKPLKITLPYPYKVTELKQDGGTWMSDVPNEMFSISMGIDEAKGHVLVGGLGIGYCIQKMANKPNVSWVTVVEKSPEVIKLVAPYLRKDNVDVIQGDLYTFLKKTKHKYDYCYYDIWASTGERELDTHVYPLRKLSRRVLKPGGKVRCWGEDEMFGQVAHGRETKRLLLKTPEGRKMLEEVKKSQENIKKACSTKDIQEAVIDRP